MTFQVDELTPATYTATLVDENGAAVAGSTLDTLTLTLYDAASGSIINNRSAQDVLNNNDVTVSDAGLLTWEIQISDTPIVSNTHTTLVRNSSGDLVEVHKALFRATWDGGRKAVNKLLTINVVAFDKLP